MKISQILAVVLGAIALLLNTLFITEIMASPAGFLFWGTGIAPMFIISAFFSINSSSKLLNINKRELAGFNTNFWLVILWLNRVISLLYISVIAFVLYSIMSFVLFGN